MIIGVNYIDKDGEFCWAEFSSAQAAVDRDWETTWHQ